MNLLINQENDLRDPALQNFECPVIFEEYTQENYPITLPCGDTLSIKAFEQSESDPKLCPLCQTNLPPDYAPKKALLLAKILDQMRSQKSIWCSKHKKEKAVAVCTKAKLHLCLECARRDQCGDSSLIPLEKFKAYLENEAIKLEAKENQFRQEIHSKIQVSDEIPSLLNPFLIEVAKAELMKQYHSQDLLQKQEFLKQISNCPTSNTGDEQIQALKDIEVRSNQLEGLEAQEEAQKVNREANRIMKSKAIAFICNEPLKVFLDNSMEGLESVYDKNLCENLELYFQEGFNNRNEFFEKLKGLQSLDSLSLENLAAFENFGAADLERLLPLCDLSSIYIDFTGIRKVRNEKSGLEEFFNALEENSFLDDLRLSFKASNFASEKDLFALSDLLHTASVRKIYLDFEKCEEITNEVVQELLLTVKRFREVHLNLLHCPHLTQEILQQIPVCFWNDEHVGVNFYEALTFKLGHSQHISSSWLQSFGEHLKGMRIKRLGLHFQACPEIESHGVSRLVSAICQVGFLRELSLSFVDCEKLENIRVLKDVAECVKRLKNLKLFMLCVQECPKFHFDDLGEFRNEIKSLPVVVDLHF